VRSKPGEGLGYGFGLSAKTSFGTATLEFAWSDTRDNQVIFTLGERF
jgi:outer membrane protein insertion porin family